MTEWACQLNAVRSEPFFVPVRTEEAYIVFAFAKVEVSDWPTIGAGGPSRAVAGVSRVRYSVGQFHQNLRLFERIQELPPSDSEVADFPYTWLSTAREDVHPARPKNEAPDWRPAFTVRDQRRVSPKIALQLQNCAPGPKRVRRSQNVSC